MPKKSEERERPGVVIYFDALPTLRKLSDEAKGKFLMACLEYGKNLDVPVFRCDDLRDQIRLETLWEQTQPRIESDGQGWKDGIIQRKFAGYSNSLKRKGEEPMTYEEYREWYFTREAADNGDATNYPITTDNDR